MRRPRQGQGDACLCSLRLAVPLAAPSSLHRSAGGGLLLLLLLLLLLRLRSSGGLCRLRLLLLLLLLLLSGRRLVHSWLLPLPQAPAAHS